MTLSKRLLSTALLIVGIVVAHFVAVRPWYLAWGATPAEVAAEYPGDDLFPRSGTSVTRAITIAAPVDRVWPWVAQTGQDRGGFHSYDLLENLVGCEMPLGDSLRPTRQSWTVGDTLWMYPREKAGGSGHVILRVFQPGRTLVFAGRSLGASLETPEDGTWGFHLRALDDGRTRLIARGAGSATRPLAGRLFDGLLFDPMHFMMERRMLLGLQAVAEGRSRQRGVNDAMALLFLATGALTLVALVRCLVARRHGLALAALFACAAVVQVLTLVQPPLPVAMALALAAAVSVALTWVPRPSEGPRTGADVAPYAPVV